MVHNVLMFSSVSRGRRTFFRRQPRLARRVRSATTIAAVSCSAFLLTGCSSVEGSLSSSSTTTANTQAGVENLTTTVNSAQPWNKTSFIEGLQSTADGRLLVGTGMYGQSRIYFTKDGVESNSQPLDRSLFGEGVAITGDTVWQLTWREHKAIKRKASTLEQVGEASYDTEGWGLCAQKDRLVMSDGSGSLTFRDPQTFAKTGSVKVTLNGKDTSMLNELECTSDGMVWANVWQTNQIYRIDPASGKVTGVADTTGLLPAAKKPGADVLNGITAVPGTTPEQQRFFITGKYWDQIYDVTFSRK